MNETPTQQPRTIGSPDRFVIDLDGNVHWYDTLTLCLERADGVIDLALSQERDRGVQPGTRPPTMYSVLCTAQQELDDIRHVLRQWYDAGMPGDGEPVAGAPGAAVTKEASTYKDVSFVDDMNEHLQDAFTLAALLTHYSSPHEGAIAYGGTTVENVGYMLEKVLLNAKGSLGKWREKQKDQSLEAEGVQS